jgi:hypothetical protein
MNPIAGPITLEKNHLITADDRLRGGWIFPGLDGSISPAACQARSAQKGRGGF